MFSIYASNTEITARLEDQTSLSEVCLSRPSFAKDSWQVQEYFWCSAMDSPELVYNSGAYRCSESVLTWTRKALSLVEEYTNEGGQPESVKVGFLHLLRECAREGLHDLSIGERLDSCISRASRNDGQIDFMIVNNALASDLEDIAA